MDINATLFGQMITFAIFVWVTMKFVWPPLVRAMDERANTIAKGLKDARESAERLAQAETEAKRIVEAAKQEASDLVDQAQQRRTSLLDTARAEAEAEKKRIVDSAQEDIHQQVQAAKEQVLAQMSDLVVEGVSKVLDREASAKDHKAILDNLVKDGE